jgi:peptidoglycan/LPS O-acetylase OafA/YrhL
MGFSSHRTPELDGLRGIAVLLVLIWHFIGEVFTPNLGIVSKIVYGTLIFGRTGVDLFFVLSGYLIVGILIDRRASPNLFRVFYIRRAARILPPYLFLIAIFWSASTVLAPNEYFGKTIPLWAYLLFVQNWFMSFNNAWGPAASSVTWSVAIEEQFYSVVPALVFFTPLRHLKWLLLSIAVASAGARAGVHYGYPASAFAPYVNTLLRLDALCIGGVIAIVVRSPEVMKTLKEYRNALSRTLIALIAVIPIFMVSVFISVHHTTFYWGHSYLAILYGTLLLWIIIHQNTIITAIFRRRDLRFLGSISYSIYLFHPMIIGVLFMLDGRTESLSSGRDALILSVALVATIGFSWLLFVVIESKMIAFGHSFRYLPDSNPNRLAILSPQSAEVKK